MEDFDFWFAECGGGWFDGGMAGAGERDSLPLDYAGPTRKKGLRPWIAWSVIGVFVALLAVVFLQPMGVRPRSVAIRAANASNLRQIAVAINMYCHGYQGQYPDTFASLLLSENISPSFFICPGSADTVATGPTTQAVAANLMVPGHCSYEYIGSGLTMGSVPKTAVIAYEPIANEGGTGANVLLGDWHVEFVNAATAGQILSKVSAKVFPVTMPVN